MSQHPHGDRPDTEDADFDAIVLGAGISGLVSASILVEQGNRRVVVVDEYPRVGGNHIDVSINGYTFDIGSLIFQDDSPLLAHFPELLPGYVVIDPTWSRLNPQGKITEYPFSVRDDVVDAGPIEWLRLGASVLVGRLRRRRMHNARDFAEFWLGARFMSRSGLAHYMARFCGLPIERIDLKFAEKRMMWIAEHSRVKNIVQRLRQLVIKAPPAPPGNRQLARPVEGFDHLYAPAVRRLQERGVTFALGVRADRLRREADGFELTVGDRRYRAPRVFSTIPIDHVRALTALAGADERLPNVVLITLFYSFSGDRGFAEPILYNFSHGGSWKRLTVYSDFYGAVAGREYFAVEVIAVDDAETPAAAADSFRTHTAANGLFDGDLRLEGSHRLPQAYPIYTEGSGDRAEAAIAELRAFGIESYGRQGGFQYQPTARVSTQEAEAALQRAVG